MSGRKLIIFGGNGFVGTAVTRTAVQAGWNVVVACRSGVPTLTNDPLTCRAQYVALDALSRSQVTEFLDDHTDAVAIVSCIGKLTTDAKEGRRVNGDPAVNATAAMYERKHIQKHVFISAADMQPVNRWFLKGYYQGKRAAERAMLENIPNKSVILRPGFIYGTRYVRGGTVPVPLHLAGVPMRAIFSPLHRILPFSILTPPISVEEVARAAVYSCLDPSVTGVHDVTSIAELSKKLDVPL